MQMSKTRALVECAVMIAIATVLSLIKLVDLPYGGSVTIASSLPIIILAYRHGLGWGLGSGVAYAVLQQLLGLKTLGWVTTWQSIVAVILLDYIVAFTVMGLGGVFRKAIKSQPAALVAGALLASVLRYACHVISGATVWAGLSIPTTAALVYSFAYNATYMIPETLVLVIAAYYIGSLLDFRRDQPTRLIKSEGARVPALHWLAGLLVAGVLIFDVASVFARLQNAETGDFNIAGLAAVNWPLVGIVSAAGLAVAAVLWLVGRRPKTKQA